ncbi:MAG: CMP-binding protein [Gemmataceae bacterium]
MTRRYIRQLADGDAVEQVFFVAESCLRANRHGGLYLQMELRDRSGSVEARLWNADEGMARRIRAGSFIHVRGKAQIYQGQLQLIVNEAEVVERERIAWQDFFPHAEKDLALLTTRLRSLLQTIRQPALKALVHCFLADGTIMDRFGRVPAGVRNHHAYIGGLLEHVVRLLEAADRLLGPPGTLFPELDRDLCLAGIFVHDIGKVRELTAEEGFAYTDEGQLVGHLAIGLELLNEKIVESERLTGQAFPTELALRLKHIILSHHGSYEFGSPVVPMTPEAIFVHYLDSLDAKVHSFARDIVADLNPHSAWTSFQPHLGRRLFKGRSGLSPLEPPEGGASA